MKKVIHNIGTGEITEIEMTEAEIAENENYNKIILEKQKIKEKEIEAKTAARQAILDRLGLTEEEAKLLLS